MLSATVGGLRGLLHSGTGGLAYRGYGSNSAPAVITSDVYPFHGRLQIVFPHVHHVYVTQAVVTCTLRYRLYHVSK